MGIENIWHLRATQGWAWANIDEMPHDVPSFLCLQNYNPCFPLVKAKPPLLGCSSLEISLMYGLVVHAGVFLPQQSQKLISSSPQCLIFCYEKDSSSFLCQLCKPWIHSDADQSRTTCLFVCLCIFSLKGGGCVLTYIAKVPQFVYYCLHARCTTAAYSFTSEDTALWHLSVIHIMLWEHCRDWANCHYESVPASLCSD